MILLDSSFLIDFFGGVETTRDMLHREHDANLVTTTISYHETMGGLKHKGGEREKRFFVRFFKEVRLLPFDERACRVV
ncbi:MAG: type II toxin-antitoxin system VapC family toxin [Candidatus Thorarchaeota archaeon]